MIGIVYRMGIIIGFIGIRVQSGVNLLPAFHNSFEKCLVLFQLEIDNEKLVYD